MTTGFIMTGDIAEYFFIACAHLGADTLQERDEILRIIAKGYSAEKFTVPMSRERLVIELGKQCKVLDVRPSRKERQNETKTQS